MRNAQAAITAAEHLDGYQLDKNHEFKTYLFEVSAKLPCAVEL